MSIIHFNVKTEPPVISVVKLQNLVFLMYFGFFAKSWPASQAMEGMFAFHGNDITQRPVSLSVNFAILQKAFGSSDIYIHLQMRSSIECLWSIYHYFALSKIIKKL